MRTEDQAASGAGPMGFEPFSVTVYGVDRRALVTAASRGLGLAAVVMASINIFGGFAVTSRMLAMYKKKGR